jgi:hypothetical protein
MTTLFSRSFSGFIPVTSKPNVPPDKSKQEPDPDVGGRWGRPAAYSWSAIGMMANGGFKEPWVELIENNDNPPRRTRILDAGVTFGVRRVVITQDSNKSPSDGAEGGEGTGGGSSIKSDTEKTLPFETPGGRAGPVRDPLDNDKQTMQPLVQVP